MLVAIYYCVFEVVGKLDSQALNTIKDMVTYDMEC